MRGFQRPRVGGSRYDIYHIIGCLTFNQRATLGYAAPFIVFIALMAIERSLRVPALPFYALRFIIVSLVILTVARPYLSLRPERPLASVLLGVAVFVIWIAPDQIF